MNKEQKRRSDNQKNGHDGDDHVHRKVEQSLDGKKKVIWLLRGIEGAEVAHRTLVLPATYEAHEQRVIKKQKWNSLLIQLHKLSKESDAFESVTQFELEAISSQIQVRMAWIRPHAVRLVDSWQIPDYLLDSALGRYGGRVYEDLFNRAHRLNPLNRITFNPNYWDEKILMGTGVTGRDVLAKL
ncbi:hypothetical protein N7539_001648 [Penicillium diatomitis]|uniref:Acyl-CoA oxidase C-terminal domain-containing protein n=1 Tax=Penicillium diatomitis TaxID=2819901 RepID=A0A9W9XH61_9EURO|nr:uncharacterized protein N7539_001648 [Penicillium diatomitis]KAJ5492902.1 hypothetical protein N7539_001648 [Penicillium diatomitis]